jgi:hypothetical protein
VLRTASTLFTRGLDVDEIEARILRALVRFQHGELLLQWFASAR